MDPITLYGGAFSLYTGRARSYLIKEGIAYREEPHSSDHFYNVVLPKAGGRRGIPTIEFSNGDVIRDGIAIIDHYENLNGGTSAPKTPKQNILSLLFDVIGAEGMLRPCMHYRFNQGEEEGDFLTFHFSTVYPEKDGAKNRIAFIKREVLPAWGVTPNTEELIETMHLKTLKTLNAHFSKYPYLFGGKPSIGDFGMIAPLYGHLGRDPVPLSLMQINAPRLFRWVERMNRLEPDIGEFENRSTTYLDNDEIPETLIDILKHFAIDFIPESLAAYECVSSWLQENKDLPSGTEVSREVGKCKFQVDGVTIDAVAQPFRFYLMKRLQNQFDSLNAKDQEEVRQLLEQCNMDEVLDMRLSREMGRANNLEVWL
jgi:glutathione S-transferase|tara:strand:+ start:21 stop:1130 length:1110 start_codon:yes stop_codon:yes gene_type:complete